MMNTVLQDLRYGLRMLRKNPGFTAVAVLTLALGIGANTAIFSLLDQVLLRSLPVAEPDRLVLLSDAEYRSGWSTSDNSEMVYSYPHYKDVRDRVPLFDGVIARAGVRLSVSGVGISERAQGEIISGNYFPVLGVRPAAGRLLDAGDDGLPGASPVAVLSYSYWSRRFGANPYVVGQKIILNNYPFTVVGVAARGFNGVLKGQSADVFVPIAMKRELTPGWNGLVERDIMWLNIFARLKAGTSRQRTEALLQVAYVPILEAEIQSAKHPSARFRERYLRQHISLRPAAQGINLLAAAWGEALLILMGMVGLVLMITCANVAGLLMAKGAARRKEIAVRMALGAGRRAVVRQLLLESLVLGAAGGLAALWVAVWSSQVLIHLLPEDAAGGLATNLDVRMLVFNVAVALGAGLLFGILPALQSARTDISSALKDAAGSIASERSHARWRQVLVAGQFALSLLLLVAAGLFGASLVRLLTQDPGFQAENLATFAVDPVLSGYSAERSLTFFQDLEKRLAALPGVTAVGAAGGGPFEGSDRTANVTVEGYRAREDEDMHCSVDAVSADYFHVLEIPLLEGREFTASDGQLGPKVAVVNEQFARFFFPNRSAPGRHLAFGAGDAKLDIEIVGVVRNSYHDSLREKIDRFIYIPYLQNTHSGLALHYYARSALNGPALTSAIRRTVAEMDAHVPVYHLTTVKSQIAESVYSDRLVAWLTSAFGLLATTLAAIGLYGLIAYTVARRTPEIGVRVALGADARSVLWLIMREVLVLASAGVALGIPLALALERVVQSRLFGVAGANIVLFVVGAALALLAAAAIAGLVPARRATKVDPIVALRYE
jgi:predicted permease